MMKRSVLTIMMAVFVLGGAACVHGKSFGRLFISTEKDEYRVGDVMAVTIAFDNVKNPFKSEKGTYGESFASIPELTYEDGRPVKKVPLYRGKLWDIPQKGARNNPFVKGQGEITVGWRVERKVWRDEATGEVIYDGVGMEAGAAPKMGAYLYMLEKVPGTYNIKLNWIMNPVVNRSDYSVDMDKTDTRTSNTISITILPALARDPLDLPDPTRVYWELWVKPERDMVFYPDKVIEFMGLKNGDKVADVGAGSGYFTFKFAKVVGPLGRIYAIDDRFSGELADFMQKRISDPADNPYNNVVLIKNPSDTVGLKPEEIDAAFMCLDGMLLVSPKDILYPSVKERYDRQLDFVRSVYNSLKPGGKLAVIDIVRDDSSDELAKRAGFTYPLWLIYQACDLEGVKRNFSKAGFRFVASSDMYMDKEHDKDIEKFKKTDMYVRSGPLPRFFHGRRMFLFLFEKPLDSVAYPAKGE